MGSRGQHSDLCPDPDRGGAAAQQGGGWQAGGRASGQEVGPAPSGASRLLVSLAPAFRSPVAAALARRRVAPACRRRGRDGASLRESARSRANRLGIGLPVTVAHCRPESGWPRRPRVPGRGPRPDQRSPRPTRSLSNKPELQRHGTSGRTRGLRVGLGPAHSTSRSLVATLRSSRLGS